MAPQKRALESLKEGSGEPKGGSGEPKESSRASNLSKDGPGGAGPYTTRSIYHSVPY